VTVGLPRTLFGRLLLVFLSFGAAMTLALLLVMQVSHRAYHLEADQTVNRALAATYVESNFLMADAPLTGATLHRGLGKLSAANPDVDIYLVDPEGGLVASSVPEALWRRRSIDLAPVHDFLDGAGLPIVGDDPRDPRRRDVFSAARVSIPECPAAYLYIVLHRQEHAAGAARLRALYSLGEGVGVMLLAALLAVVMSLLVVRSLTRRLSTLDATIRRFERAGGGGSDAIDPAPEALPGDEIDRLGAAFGRLATRIEAQMATLQSNDTMRREVLANVSHDLRTPVATLQAHLERLALDTRADDERREYVDVALRQTRRLACLVEQLLEAAKLDAAQVSVEAEPFAAGDLVQDVIQKFALAAEERRVRLVPTVPTGLPWVVGDVGLIERVLDNLLENALRHTPPDGRIEVAVTPHAAQLRFTVTDSGPGLQPDEAARVFDRFYRGDRSRSGRTGHAGLGLAIAKGIVELHGGRLNLDGRPGRGARFGFDLPIAGTRPEVPVRPALTA
jgi:signal transduction histidine kinase